MEVSAGTTTPAATAFPRLEQYRAKVVNKEGVETISDISVIHVIRAIVYGYVAEDPDSTTTPKADKDYILGNLVSATLTDEWKISSMEYGKPFAEFPFDVADPAKTHM